ncbi:MAG: hypothetical protein JWL90_4074 [Chthoniobacteraceae bacterium]|nr:hypothetical protein [Chthoniobacteraceae bacterium]
MSRTRLFLGLFALIALHLEAADSPAYEVSEDSDMLHLSTPTLDAAVRKKGYVTGIASLLDKKSGFRDAGYGLDIVDWIMEPGSDEAYRDKLPGDLPYKFGNLFHGNTAKRSVEGPQICTQAKELAPRVIRGSDFAAVQTSWRYTLAAPGKQAGSTWTQTIVFPAGQRYFISSDRMLSVNAGNELFFRLDMPGHIRGDTFSEVYLSYFGTIPAAEFNVNFAPDAKFNYRRDRDKTPARMIRAYHLRDPKTGAPGPWLAGMTLKATDVYEAWCHQRDYVCLIEEIGGRPVKAGDSFGAAFIVGYFDSIQEMERVYDQYAGHSSLAVTEAGWKLE